jgi:hypothetical protein
MPLNKTTGEIIGDLGTDFYVAPFARWSTTPLFAEAYDRAVEAFVTSGAILPVKITAEQVLVQEYPTSNQVAFVFQATIRGQEHLYPYVFKLEPKLVAELRTIGRWGRPH